MKERSGFMDISFWSMGFVEFFHSLFLCLILHQSQYEQPHQANSAPVDIIIYEWVFRLSNLKCSKFIDIK